MHNKLLLPHRFKTAGWLLLSVAVLFQILVWTRGGELSWLNIKVFAILDQDMGQSKYFSFIQNNVTEEIIGILFIIGGLFAGFSREKTEDEFIANLRLSSMLWAVLVNYLLLIVALIFFYDLSFFDVMVLNMFTILIIFLGRFHYILYRTSKANPHEK